MKQIPGLAILLFMYSTTMAQKVMNDTFLETLIRSKASPELKEILDNPATYRYQLIYTQVNRNKRNDPSFNHFNLNVDNNRYFNPASMVKMPLAFLALEKLNRLNIPGLNRNTSMFTDSSFPGQVSVIGDPSADSGVPSIANYIRKIFIVSDNEAYNRLYEFLGQQWINERLQGMGYKDVRITRRFMRMTEEQNRQTNRIRFMDNNKLVYDQPPATSTFRFDFSQQYQVGTAYIDPAGNRVDSPMDFTRHNRVSLGDLRQIHQSVLFPESVLKKYRFDLTAQDYRFLYQAMSELPFESRSPVFDTTEFFPAYTKFFFFRDQKQKIPANIRSFNKAGWSYGFLTDVAYIIDTSAGIEFQVAASIYVNQDGVLNDDKYEYEETGYLFFREIGQIIYDYELQRQRKYRPDLSKFILTYH